MRTGPDRAPASPRDHERAEREPPHALVPVELAAVRPRGTCRVCARPSAPCAMPRRSVQRTQSCGVDVRIRREHRGVRHHAQQIAARASPRSAAPAARARPRRCGRGRRSARRSGGTARRPPRTRTAPARGSARRRRRSTRRSRARAASDRRRGARASLVGDDLDLAPRVRAREHGHARSVGRRDRAARGACARSTSASSASRAAPPDAVGTNASSTSPPVRSTSAASVSRTGRPHITSGSGSPAGAAVRPATSSHSSRRDRAGRRATSRRASRGRVSASSCARCEIRHAEHRDRPREHRRRRARRGGAAHGSIGIGARACRRRATKRASASPRSARPASARRDRRRARPARGPRRAPASSPGAVVAYSQHSPASSLRELHAARPGAIAAAGARVEVRGDRRQPRDDARVGEHGRERRRELPAIEAASASRRPRSRVDEPIERDELEARRDPARERELARQPARDEPAADDDRRRRERIQRPATPRAARRAGLAAVAVDDAQHHARRPNDESVPDSDDHPQRAGTISNRAGSRPGPRRRRRARRSRRARSARLDHARAPRRHLVHREVRALVEPPPALQESPNVKSPIATTSNCPSSTSASGATIIAPPKIAAVRDRDRVDRGLDALADRRRTPAARAGSCTTSVARAVAIANDSAAELLARSR